MTSQAPRRGRKEVATLLLRDQRTAQEVSLSPHHPAPPSPSFPFSACARFQLPQVGL